MINLVHQAADMGVTLLTPPRYGSFHNVELVGVAVVGMRNKIHVSTKFGLNFECNQAQGFNSKPD